MRSWLRPFVQRYLDPADSLENGFACSCAELEVGPLAGVSFWKVDVTGYVFSLGTSETNYTLIVGISF